MSELERGLGNAVTAMDLLEEVARLREVLAAARAVSDVYDGSDAGRALWDAIAAYDAASRGGDDAG